MLWAGDARVKLLANLGECQKTVLVSLTGPGADVLPWDPATVPPGEKPSGKNGARVLPVPAEAWNRTSGRRWRDLNSRASQNTRRRFGCFRLAAREWELQKRGVWHLHLVVDVTTARALAAAHFYVAELDRLSRQYGFGYVDRGKLTARQSGRRRLVVREGEHAARYLAKYLAPVDGDGKLSLTETVLAADGPKLLSHVGRHLTAETGVTMRTLRMRRHAYVLASIYGTSTTAELTRMLGHYPSKQLRRGALVDDAVANP